MAFFSEDLLCTSVVPLICFVSTSVAGGASPADFDDDESEFLVRDALSSRVFFVPSSSDGVDFWVLPLVSGVTLRCAESVSDVMSLV